MKIRKESIVLALVVIILGMATMSSLFSLSVKAEFNPVITVTTESSRDKKGIQTWVSSVNNDVASADLDSKVKSHYGVAKITNLEYLQVKASSSGNEVTVTLRKIGTKTRKGYVPGYNDVDTASRNKVISIALSYLEENKDISRTTKVKLYNFIYNSDETTASMVKQLSADTRADLYAGYTTLRDLHILKLASWLLGVISLLIFIVLAITISLDLAYINIPIIQLMFKTRKLPKFCNKGETEMQNQLISYEARQAVELYANSQSGHSMEQKGHTATGYYLLTKTKQMSALFTCLLYLVSGQIYTLLAEFMDLFRQALGM